MVLLVNEAVGEFPVFATTFDMGTTFGRLKDLCS